MYTERFETNRMTLEVDWKASFPLTFVEFMTFVVIEAGYIVLLVCRLFVYIWAMHSQNWVFVVVEKKRFFFHIFRIFLQFLRFFEFSIRLIIFERTFIANKNKMTAASSNFPINLYRSSMWLHKMWTFDNGILMKPSDIFDSQ